MTARRSEKIAVLVPTFNGGRLLHETVASPALAGLSSDAYEIVVSDNASDDGSVDSLSGTDAQGVPVHIRRNAENLGRVQNWNRALDAANQLGFGHATFLMAGDTLKDESILALRQRMVASGAALGLASYEIVDGNSRPLRVARRINWRGEAIAPDRFLRQSLGRGAMLCAPLGANLYRLGAVRPAFAPEDASHTDQQATASFAVTADSPVVYLDRPISRWRQRAGRFHNAMTPAERLRNDLRVIECSCREAGIEPDFPKIRATMMLRSLFHGSGWRALPGDDSGGVSWSWLARLVYRQLRYHTPWLIET